MNHISLLNAALETIDTNLTRDICADHLALQFGYSRSHFDRLFTRALGESLGNYIRRRKLIHAAHALATSTQKIIEIALDHGFDSHEAFTRAFQRAFIHSPAAYRRTYAREDIRPALWPNIVVRPHEQVPARVRVVTLWQPLHKTPLLAGTTRYIEA